MKLRKTEMGLVGPNMTPMIGLLFLLFMFFMISISLENTKADERLKLPKAMLAKPPTVKTEHELVLNMGYQRGRKGDRLNSVPEILYNERYVEVRQIAPHLEQEKRVLERVYGKGVVNDVTVLIRADAETPAGLIQELIKKCQEAGFSKFSMRTTPKEV